VEHSLDEIVLVPRNGYVNRLQAWASADILASQLNAPLRVIWEPEDAAPASAELFFESELLRQAFRDRRYLDALVNSPHESLPRYLNLDVERRLVVLAGHDQGEQIFMSQLTSILAHPCAPRTLLIIAGGVFHLPGQDDPIHQRYRFYRWIKWRQEIDERVRVATTAHPEYVAVHIRGTDRSREAPPSRALRCGLQRLLDSTGQTRLFIAADTADSRDRWADIAQRMGFAPWWATSVEHDRSRPSAGTDAIVDWRLLGAAESLVYTTTSSFGHEAAVATGHFANCIPLAATPARQRARAGLDLARVAVTYPVRHWLHRR